MCIYIYIYIIDSNRFMYTGPPPLRGPPVRRLLPPGLHDVLATYQYEYIYIYIYIYIYMHMFIHMYTYHAYVLLKVYGL